MNTYITGLTKDGKWHCFLEDSEPKLLHIISGTKYYDEMARQFAKALIEGNQRPWLKEDDKLLFTCCVHAQSRYQAIKLTKTFWQAHLLENIRVNEEMTDKCP